MQSPNIASSVLLGLISAAVAWAGEKPAPVQKQPISVVEYDRRTVYHGPQTPGFTCWTGAWVMDDSLMISFTQATGPIEGRPRVPDEIGQKLNWPPKGHPNYDMTGLDLKNVHLRSFDGGQTWNRVSADPFRSCMNGCTGQCETALPDGTVIRGVWGHYLPYDPDLPKTGYLQRSRDETKTWGPPEVLLDPERQSAWPKRIRRLRDGSLIVIGGVADVPANSLTRHEYGKILQPLLIVSRDDGKTWSRPIPVVPPEHRNDWGGEEFDAAELPGGDLLCVFRRRDPGSGRGEVRWQGVLKKEGAIWLPQDAGPAPFPHSGHPELLATREGIILHLATTGVHWTKDAGQSWHALDVPPTRYYPRAVQAADGRIHVFGHVGGDNAYGSVDQSIVMDTFRLVVASASEKAAEKSLSAAADKTSSYVIQDLSQTTLAAKPAGTMAAARCRNCPTAPGLSCIMRAANHARGCYTQRGHNLREPVRWASEPVEGCYPKATGSEAHRTGQFTFG